MGNSEKHPQYTRGIRKSTNRGKEGMRIPHVQFSDVVSVAAFVVSLGAVFISWKSAGWSYQQNAEANNISARSLEVAEEAMELQKAQEAKEVLAEKEKAQMVQVKMLLRDLAPLHETMKKYYEVKYRGSQPDMTEHKKAWEAGTPRLKNFLAAIHEDSCPTIYNPVQALRQSIESDDDNAYGVLHEFDQALTAYETLNGEIHLTERMLK